MNYQSSVRGMFGHPGVRSETVTRLLATACVVLYCLSFVGGGALPGKLAMSDQSGRQDEAADGKKIEPVPQTGNLKEFHIGGYWGLPYTHRSDVVLKRDPDIDLISRGVGWDGLPAKSPIYYGWRLTQWMGPSPFGGMIDFTHNKTLARKDEVLEMKGRFRGETIDGPKKLKDIYQKLELSHGHNTLLATGLLRLPVGGGKVSPYIGAGAGIAIPHFEVHLADEKTRTYEYQLVGFAGQVLGGVEFRVAEKLSLFLEYKLIFAPVRGTLKSEGGGLLNLNLWSHQIVGGVNFRFAQGAPAS